MLRRGDELRRDLPTPHRVHLERVLDERPQNQRIWPRKPCIGQTNGLHRASATRVAAPARPAHVGITPLPPGERVVGSDSPVYPAEPS